MKEIRQSHGNGIYYPPEFWAEPASDHRWQAWRALWAALALAALAAIVWMAGR